MVQEALHRDPWMIYPTTGLGERFQVLPLEHGLIALYNVHHNRFLRMTNQPSWAGIDSSTPMIHQAMPAGWTWERWQVVDDGVNPHVPGRWTFNGLR